MTQVLRYLRSFAAVFLALTSFVVFNPSVFAAMLPFTQADLDQIRIGQIYRDPNDTCVTTGSNTTGISPGSGSTVYIVGDSITVGATPALLAPENTNGLSVRKINAVVSRSVTSPGEGTENGLQAVDNDAADVEIASTVVIALGTNGGTAQNIQDMIDKVREHNKAGRIYWVNVFSGPSRDSFNAALESQATAFASTNRAFTVIDTTAAKIEVGSDNVHPTSAGQTAFAQTVLNAVRGNTSTTRTAAGCSCSVSGATNGTNEENERQVWAYFTGTKGLSPEAAAGLMGSIAPESGFNPHNTQNTAPVPDGPEIPIDAIRGKWGYGLIQWTSAGRQENLVAYARETNRSTGDLGLQLDFLWKELSERYTGTLTALQTPGITVREASDEVTLRFVTPGSVTREHGTAASRAETLNERGGASQGFFDKYSGQTVSYMGGTGCGATGAKIDLESRDTTNIPCGGGTQDAGVADGYRDGKLYKIRLCTVGGTQVNSQLAASAKRLLDDSAAAGVNLSFGSFRTMERQESMYRERCAAQGKHIPEDEVFPKPTAGDNVSCDTIAPPGYSNHQMGLAIDVSCNGRTITRYQPAAASNPCFQWLVANAAKYSLYEFGKGEGNRTSGSYEAWHWSVDGN